MHSYLWNASKDAFLRSGAIDMCVLRPGAFICAILRRLRNTDTCFFCEMLRHMRFKGEMHWRDRFWNYRQMRFWWQVWWTGTFSSIFCRLELVIERVTSTNTWRYKMAWCLSNVLGEDSVPKLKNYNNNGSPRKCALLFVYSVLWLKKGLK